MRDDFKIEALIYAVVILGAEALHRLWSWLTRDD
jgi:hypothetical protein